MPRNSAVVGWRRIDVAAAKDAHVKKAWDTFQASRAALEKAVSNTATVKDLMKEYPDHIIKFGYNFGGLSIGFLPESEAATATGKSMLRV